MSEQDGFVIGEKAIVLPSAYEHPDFRYYHRSELVKYVGKKRKIKWEHQNKVYIGRHYFPKEVVMPCNKIKATAITKEELEQRKLTATKFNPDYLE